jgi:hypothetical protein
MKAPMLLALAGLLTAQATEPTGKLTLACRGTAIAESFPDAKPEPISMGIIVDFAAGTVDGFGLISAQIIGVDKTKVRFRGRDENEFVVGGIDRVTGDVGATTVLGKVATSYSLQCKPTQQMF